MMVFNFAACVPVWICVGMFSIYHIWLVSSNTTTIERWEKDKVSTLVRRGKITAIRFPYNIGFLGNMRSVLGPRWYLWLWPQPMQGSGLSYAVNPEAGGKSIAEWAGVVARDRAYERGYPLSGGPEASGVEALQARLRGHLAPAPGGDAGDIV